MREVVFDVTVNAVKESKIGVLNDEFVAENTEFATVEECRKGIREELEKMAEDNVVNQKRMMYLWLLWTMPKYLCQKTAFRQCMTIKSHIMKARP